MSSLTVLQTKENIVFASDTAISVTYNNKSYRVSNQSKIIEFKDFIMFASGKMWLRDLLLRNLKENPTVDEVEEVLHNIILNKSDYYSLEVLIGMKDLSKVVIFSSTDKFKRVESLPSSDIKLYTAGYKTDEFANLFITKYENEPVYSSLVATYKELSDDRVGGKLQVYNLDGNVNFREFEIDDIKCYSDEEVYKSLNLVHAVRLVGKIIIGERLYMEDENGVWETRGSTTTIFDRNGRPSMYIGQLENNCFGIRMDNAKHIVNLSTCDGFKLSKYLSGGNVEDVLIADFEGNFYSKYWTHDTTKIVDSKDYFELDDNEIVIKDGSSEVMRMGYIPSMNFGGCSIGSDWGVVLKGNNNSLIYMTRNRGFAIDVNCSNKFSVNSSGNLYAQDIEATNLMIKTAKIGNNIVINETSGITITSGATKIMMNGTDGFKITNNNQDIFYVGSDGKLYARNFYTLDAQGEKLEDLDGSFISDLTVNRLKTLSKNNRLNYVHVENNFIRFNTETQTKLEISFIGEGLSAFPQITWGSGDGMGGSRAYQYKDPTSFVTEYYATDGRRRSIELTDMANAGIIMESPYGVTMNLGGTTIEINPTGIFADGSKVVDF